MTLSLAPTTTPFCVKDVGASARGVEIEREVSWVESEDLEGRVKKEYWEFGRLWCDDDEVLVEECRLG